MRKTIRIDGIVSLFSIIYFAASFLTTAYSFAKYIMILCAVLIALCAAWMNKGELRVRIEAFHLFTVAFMMFCFSSMLWAINYRYAFYRAMTILQILIAIFLVYLYYQNRSIKQLLMIAMLGGYVVSLIALADQGLDVYINGILKGIRVYDQEYINGNVMGMLMASSIVLSYYYIIYEKKVGLWTLFIIPAFVCLAGAGSRKSIVLLIGGCFILTVLHNFSDKKLLRSFLRAAFFVSLFLIAVYIFIRMTPFKMLTSRFETLLNYFRGKGTVDGSTQSRMTMIELGFQIFKNHPLVGIGIENPRIFNLNVTGATYLHNNFVELLAGGGVIGFGLYYSMYAYLLYNMIKYRDYRTGEYDICLTLLLLHLVLEYGYVSYYNKETYFYFLIFFVEVKNLKRESRKRQLCRERSPERYDAINP